MLLVLIPLLFFCGFSKMHCWFTWLYRKLAETNLMITYSVVGIYKRKKTRLRPRKKRKKIRLLFSFINSHLKVRCCRMESRRRERGRGFGWKNTKGSWGNFLFGKDLGIVLLAKLCHLNVINRINYRKEIFYKKDYELILHIYACVFLYL